MQFDAHILAFKRHQAMEAMRALEDIRAGLNYEWLAKIAIVDERRRAMIAKAKANG